MSPSPGTNVGLKGMRAASRRKVHNWSLMGKRNGCIMFLWTAKWQGLHNGSPPEPSKRKFKVPRSDIANTSRLINSMYRISKRR
jgi:hypothetical protein